MAKLYYLPTAAALRTDSFRPACGTGDPGSNEEPLAVEVLDYGVVGGVLITSLSVGRLGVSGIVINGEFEPTLCAGKKGEFVDLRFPQEMEYGASLLAITTAPAANDQIRARCYHKQATGIVVSTDLGEYAFEGA